MIQFITFEGGDGAGKTTQVKLLEEHLTGRGKSCEVTREPGGTSLGKLIRQVLLEVGNKPMASPTELFLYLADRAEHVKEVIVPALEKGKIVLCDRHADSTLAYQGYGRGIDVELLRRLNKITSGGTRPDLTLLLDCPVEAGLSRTGRRESRESHSGGRADRFEQEKVEFHERVRQGFLELARSEPERIYVVDAARSIGDVFKEIKGIVDQRLV